MYGLADCNNFYASCERVFNPSLQNLPVVILSNNDGCVISRSNEAKLLGIKMGQPIFELQELVEINNVKVFSSNFILYGDMSTRVMDTLKSFSPSTEIYSIDEAFLDLSGIDNKKLNNLGINIVETVKRNTGIPISLGISKTKTLAKIASKLCKKYPKLNGVCVMIDDSDIYKVLKKFPIEDVWGIGRKYSKKLNNMGVHTAYDFINLSPVWIKSNMSIVGVKTWKELKGEACIEFEEIISDKKQICTSRSFSKNIDDLEELYKSIAHFTSISAEKLRKQKCVTGQIQVFILTNVFRKDLPQYYQSVVVPLENHTDSTLELVKFACKALSKIYKQGYYYKKAGVILTEISKKSETPGSLFCETDLVKHNNLMDTIDKLNRHYGKHSIKLLAEGVEGIKSKRMLLSPKYTTSWSDIIEVIV